MKFNVTFKNDEGKTVEFKTGRTSLWSAQDHVADYPNSPAKAGRLSFAWGYYAALKAKKLKELGVKDLDAPVEDVIEFLADEWDLDIDEATGNAPLANAPSK